MALRRSSNRTSPSSPNHTLGLRKYALRRAPSFRRRAFPDRRNRNPHSHASSASTFSSSADTLRPVLVPLHPNLRRLPSRLFSAQKDAMRMTSQSSSVIIGTKRKRTVSTNENSHTGNRPLRGQGKIKRMRSASRQDCSSDENETSSMNVDAPSSWAHSDDSDTDEDSSAEHLISDAPPRQLLRLRKEELVHLYNSAGLSENPEALTKQEIVDVIVAARDDFAPAPPSSPPGVSSGYSSDEGNAAGDEENNVLPRYEVMPNGLRRRATTNYLSRPNEKPCKGRSLSMGNLLAQNSFHEGRKTARILDIKKNGEGSVGSTTRRKASHGTSKSSSTPASSSKAPPSPPATRLRSRKIPADSGSSGTARGKGKGKQVGFEDELQVEASQSNSDDDDDEEQDSDSTEAAESETPSTHSVPNPSPRRLRSRGRKSVEGQLSARGRSKSSEGMEGVRRVVPRRKAKEKIGSLKEEDDDEEDLDEEDELQEDEAGNDEEDVVGDEEEAEEVDELISSASPTPPPPPRGRRTPVKRRLRPRRVQVHAPSSDADDEDEDDVDDGGEDEDEEEQDNGEERCGDEDDDTEIADEDDDDQEMTVVVEPRKLRNGKIVGEEEIAEETGEEDEDEGGLAEDPDGEVDLEETEDSDGNESMEDVDLTAATAKALVRLRRDDLVRLCETRDLEAVGTKPQLAEALLQWRDRRTNGFSSPSSSGTIRPPSTMKRRTNGRWHSRGQTQSDTPPVLLRPGHVHIDGPRTPPLSQNHRDAEPELELDLESLGLDDREIPPEKLTKLEKIGSGGFKDVFIGRFKGRRVAISEFRGQLNEMDINELKLLGGFNHPNIVRFVGVSIPENSRDTPVMMVSELCSNGDLFDYVRKVPPPSLHKVLGMMLDIARGLEYLHEHKPSVIHRDCKSSNILITSKGTAKIADFGLAKVKQSTKSMVRSLVGTVNWQAPELWHAHPKYNHKVDVFSCSMVYWEMLQWHQPNPKFPWEGMNEHAIYDIVGAKKQRPSVSGLRKQWCPEIIDLIERMWAQEHQDRPTMSEVVEELENLVH